VPSTLLYTLGLGAGAILENAAPLSLPEARISVMQMFLGGGLAAAGLALFVWAVSTFARARTGIMPERSASCVVIAGPYRWSRNPMYVAFTAIYLGVAVALDLPWALLLLPGVMAALLALVIRREERYMQGVFGAAYDSYCRRVPRWL